MSPQGVIRQGTSDCAADYPTYERLCLSKCHSGQSYWFSLHAGVASEAHEREKLERLCRRYITRPSVSTERLSLTAQGNVRYRLVAPAHPCARDIRASLHIKTPYRDGTTDAKLV